MTRYQSGGGLPTNDNAYKPLLNHDFPSTATNKKKAITRRCYGLIAAALAVFGVTSIYLSSQVPNHDEYSTFQNVGTQNLWGGDSRSVVAPGISYASFKYGLSQCQQITKQQQQKLTQQQREKEDTDDELPRRQRNPRGPVNTTLLVKNGYIWLGDRYLDGGDVLIKDGLILEVGLELSTDDENVKVINAEGRVITPGIVDMHTHATAASLPDLDATADENEMTHPTTPYVRKNGYSNDINLESQPENNKLIQIK